MKINEIAENISHTSKRLRDIERKHKVKPGTDEWFKLWFSLPYLKESTLSEGYKLQLERDPNMYVLHITDTKTGKRTEVRGKPDYETTGYDANDKLHQLLDKLGKSANFAELINGEVVTINPKHPDAEKAKAATDVAFNEDVEVDLHGNADRGYVLSKIEVPKDQRGQGVGSRIMQQIVDRMDKEGAVIALTPDSVFGGSKSKLIDFYKRFGFVPNKGRNKDFRFRETMIRYPKQINEAFVKPQFDVEWEEAERYPEFVKIGKEAWIKLVSKGKAVTIKSAKGINNTDAADPDSFKLLDPAKQKRALAQLDKGSVEMPIVAVYSDGWKELIGGNTRLTAMMARDGKATVWVFKVPDSILENVANVNEETGVEMLKIFRTMHHDTAKNKEMDAFIKAHEWELRDFTPDMFPSEEEFFDYDDPFNRVIDIDYNHRVDLSQPIIVGPQYSDGKYSVIDGNHRAAAAQAAGKTIKGYFPIIKENFADGKVKGKSKPGRVKAAGASCNGSVTELRRKAKNSSGEKQKMYHWCANMKAGKKK